MEIGLHALTLALVKTSFATLKKMTQTITPNEYSESVGEDQVKADENEYFEFGSDGSEVVF